MRSEKPEVYIQCIMILTIVSEALIELFSDNVTHFHC